MFADIAGYTAIMQQNEAEGIAKASRFHKIMQQEVAHHGGELLELRGDGSLSIFNSALDAVRCAQAIQINLRGVIPLRIGVHLGDIAQKEGHIFGNAVNIASRLESMSEAGAVLVSDNVRNQLKNKNEFELKLMGNFSFKNVEGEMAVYALANPGFVVPEPRKMKGKGRKVEAGKLTPRQLIRLGSMGFVAMAVGMLLFWIIASRNPDSTSLLPQDIRQSKVAVNVFENFTGDPDLDALGYLASEWISSGLREHNIQTVSPDLVRHHKDKVGILPGNPENKPSFAEISGASYVITGSYFLEGDTIAINTRLSSTLTGEDIQSFPQLKAHKSEKEWLVNEIRQYLLGYWIQKQDLVVPDINPPKYEAYRFFVDPAEQGSFDWIPRALAIDSNFIFARSLQTYSAVVADDDTLFYHNKAWINKRWNKCTTYEKNWFREAFALWEGDYTTAFQAMDANYQIHPEDMLTLHESGFVAVAGLNRPDIAVERYERIFNHLDIYKDQILDHSFRYYFLALNRLGAHSKVSDFFMSLPDMLKERAGDAVVEVVLALIHENQIEAAKNRIRANQPADLLRAAYAYAFVYPDAEMNPFAGDLRRRLDEFEYYATGWESRVLALYVLKEWQQAEALLLDLSKAEWEDARADAWHPYQEALRAAALLGTVYARQGKREAALAQAEKVRDLGARFHAHHHSHFRRGETPYYLARIYAVLGEHERAVGLLQSAIEQGKLYNQWDISFDLDFVKLRGYDPFEQLLAPQTAHTP